MTLTPSALSDEDERRSQQPTGGRQVSAMALLRSGTLWQPAVLLLFIVFGTQLFGRSSAYPLLVLAGIYGIAVVGVSLLAGLGGQLSLGHAAFMGIGAYASAIATVQGGLPTLVGVLIGLAAALVVAFVTIPVLRLRGWYLAMATIALAFILQRVAVNLSSVTGGNNGIYGIPPFSVGGFVLQGEKQYFLLVWSVVLVLFVLGRNVGASRFGRAMTAIHKDGDAAVSAGVPLLRSKATVWLVAAVPPTIAGALFAHYSAFIAPGDFSLSTSLTLFTAVVLGGERSIFAGLVAVVFLVTLPSVAGGFVTTELIEAVGLIVVYLLSPSGAAGLLDAVRRQLRAARARHA